MTPDTLSLMTVYFIIDPEWRSDLDQMGLFGYLEVEVNHIAGMNVFHGSAYLIHKSGHFEFVDFLS